MPDSSEAADISAPLPTCRQPSTHNRFSTKRRGEIAEAAFLLKAATLGFSIAKPWGDSDRYDFILDNGRRTWRIQVKSSHCKGESGYSVHACGNCQNQVYSPDDIDFLVAYIVPEDVWYIVPVHVFTHIRAMRFFPSGKRGISRYEIYREAWCLMACPKEGHCREHIDVIRCCDKGPAKPCASHIPVRQQG
jgi:hypothetical protein